MLDCKSICLYSCLSCWVTTFLSGLDWVNNSRNPSVSLYFLPSTNTCLLLYLKVDRTISNERSVSSWKTLKLGSCDTLRVNTLWMLFECVGEVSVLIQILFKQRHWTNYTFPFRLCFRTGFCTASFNNRNGNGFPFLFLGFPVWILMEANLGLFIVAMILYFSYFFNWWWMFLGTVFVLFRRN